MSYRSNKAVEDATSAYREACASTIPRGAAELVAAGDVGRDAAIAAVAAWVRSTSEAQDELTGMIATESQYPNPSKQARASQVIAIARELSEAARDAADSL